MVISCSYSIPSFVLICLHLGRHVVDVVEHLFEKVPHRLIIIHKQDGLGVPFDGHFRLLRLHHFCFPYYDPQVDLESASPTRLAVAHEVSIMALGRLAFRS